MIRATAIMITQVAQAMQVVQAMPAMSVMQARLMQAMYLRRSPEKLLMSA
jgi:hypothetical protein